MKDIKSFMTQRLKMAYLTVATICCLLTAVDLQAQTYPINAQVVSMPPYSIYLLDYGMGNNLQVNLIQRDINGIQQEAYLNIELEGAGIRLKTLPNFRPSTYIDIVPNMMLTLNNSDLVEYFNTNNLNFEGMSRESFVANAQQLPEGLYKFKVKVLYKLNGAQASNEAMTLMSLQKGQPPFINQPFENAKVSENPMQNFTINWTARSINPSNMPSYRLQMWELLDPTQDPNIIVNSNYPPILDEFTNFTTYQHGPSNTPLTAGKTYAIRVQVVDPEGRDVYTNSGYSQVRKFVYGDACNPPTNLSATLDNRGIQANWALTPNQGGYRFQHARIDTAWTDTDVLINRFSIEKIFPSAQYQMRVATVCGNGKQSDYSDIVYVGTNPSTSNNQTSCGEEPKVNITNNKLLPSLKVGDKFTAYDFDVTVTQVFRNDSTSYAGQGKTPFYMLGGVDVVCYFDGITINTDHKVLKGEVRLQSKPYVFSDKNVKQFREDFKETQEILSQNDAATPTSVSVDVTISTVTYDSTKKEIIVNDAQGNTVKSLSSGKDYKITDKDGNVFLVSKDNKVTKQPKATETTVKGGAPVKEGGENYDIHFTENQLILTFEAHPQQIWGFDAEPMNSMVKTFYESIINTQRSYYVPYKSIGSAGTDKVIAKVERNPEDVDLKRIKFKTNTGVAVPFEYDATKEEWTLTISGTLHRQDYSIFPYYGNGKDTLCGKLNVMPLDKKEVKLVLVPLNGFKTTNVKATAIEAYLNTVFRQANIAYKVSLERPFSSAGADLPLSVEHGKLEGEYSENQAQVIVDYQVQHPENENTIYLFLCKEGSNDAVKGHTPVNRSYGFLFGETLDKRTIAHEVGHGYPLAIEHPFTTGGATGTFSNLMDYATSTNLTFMQWGGAHNPKLKVRFGQDAKEGELNVSELEQLFDWLVKNRGKKVKYDKSAYKTYDSWNTFIKYAYDGGKSGLYVELNSSSDVDLSLKYIDVSIEKHTCGTNFIMRFLRPDRSGEFIKIWTASHSSYEVLLKRLGLTLSDVTKAEVMADYQSLIKNSGKGCNDIDIIYENIPPYVIAKMKYADKVEALTSLASCSVDKVCVDESRAVLNLIGSIKDTEIDQFIAELIHNKLFEKLYNAVDWPEKEKLIALLTSKFYRSKSYKPNLDQITIRNSYLHENTSAEKGRNYDLSLSGASFDVKYLLGGFDAQGHVRDERFKLGLFETVLVVSKLELPYVDTQQKGTGLYIAKVPAIYVKLLTNRQDEKTVVTGAKMTIEAVGSAFTFYTGTGMLRAPTLLARVVGAADVASGLTSAGILTYKGIVAQKYGQNSDKYHLLEEVENIVSIYNGCRFAMDLVQLPKLIEKAGKLWNAEKTALKQERILKDVEYQKVDELLGDGTAISVNWLAKYPNIRSKLDEIASILNSAGFDRYRFENLLKQSDNLKYLEENAVLLPEIAKKIKPKYNYTDADVLKIFRDAVNTDFVKALLPTNFVNSLKTFGKTDEEIVTYFRNYHNVATRGEFFMQIEEILVKNNPYGLTRDEAYALWGYTTNFFYRDLNILLSDATQLSRTREISKLLNSALDKIPDFNRALVYRGIEVKPAALKDFLKSYEKGSINTWKGFASCGSSKDASFIMRDNINVVLEITHLNGKDISDFADGIKFRNMAPSEILIKNSTEYRALRDPFYDPILKKYVVQLRQIK